MADEYRESQQEAHRKLWLALVEAQRKCLQAVTEPDSIIGQVPSGIATPDGALRIKQTSKARRNAYDAYMRATKAFGDFLQDCIK